MRALAVVAAGPLTTIQDLGRPGYAHLGVPRSGAADRGALRLANRLVGNPEGLAAIEATVGGVTLRAEGPVVVALTGAPAQLHVDDRPVGPGATVRVRAGQVLRLDPPSSGVRSYLAVRGGLAVDPVLGSRATDTLSGLGPAPLWEGDVLRVGDGALAWPAVQSAVVRRPDEGVVVLLADDGPRADRLVDPDALFTGSWRVNPVGNRVGIRLDRLDGPPLELVAGQGELPSEGIAHGSIQVPPSGQPVVFGPDHPVTGGYPVVAVLADESLDRAGQLAPGAAVRIRRPAAFEPDVAALTHR
ncbi:MAG: biotin-dependent carboxyltransferase family protein [Gordonia sp. (in: high G+C Gram-positive bacteria)]|uniref:5-oxoprolinase subunit C family protein n=1 Tax=Gordonia sp. (in: high G+C Gram-positive bacteria) TaxID=84139 RepID=UPI0039E4653F